MARDSLVAVRRTEPPEWVQELAEAALSNARMCEREARRLRKMARMMIDPPKGVRISYGGRGVVNIFGPEAKP